MLRRVHFCSNMSMIESVQENNHIWRDVYKRQYLDYSYTWNIQENKAQAADVSESATIIPTKYDLRDRARVSAIRNQGTYGTCWSFAALSAMESVLDVYKRQGMRIILLQSIFHGTRRRKSIF